MFDLPRTNPHADALLNDSLSGARLGMPLQPILADNGALFSNRMAQPLIVAATMATWEALRWSQEVAGAPPRSSLRQSCQFLHSLR
jgi:[acyl-carrier-protein] S-malonyltransferase